MKILGAPGASISVMKDGRMIWSEGFGFADLEQRVPVTALTKFRVGSVSKPLTATALGLLYQEGKLDLDAPVQRYVPNFPQKQYPITVRQVAGHLAGIRHYRGAEFENQKHYASVTEALTIFEHDSLLFQPGAQFSYSSYGWNLVSAVVEGASGEAFLTFMQRRVFGPAGMTHTIAEHPDSIIEYRARFYTRGDSGGPILNALYVDNSYKWAGGGFLSTTEDLVRFGHQMLEGQLLRPETLQVLWASQHTSDGKETNNGIGWFTRADSLGRQRVYHSGGSMGGTAVSDRLPRGEAGRGGAGEQRSDVHRGDTSHCCMVCRREARGSDGEVAFIPEAAVPTLKDAQTRTAMVQRLRQVQPDSQPRWGTLTAPRMLCHIADQMRVGLGQIPSKDRGTLFMHTLLKWVVLYTPFQPPPGKVQTSREMLTSVPASWTNDMAACEMLIDEVGAGRAGAVHPAFGAMNGNEWALIAWKHLDHHFRQFGV